MKSLLLFVTAIIIITSLASGRSYRNSSTLPPAHTGALVRDIKVTLDFNNGCFPEIFRRCKGFRIESPEEQLEVLNCDDGDREPCELKCEGKDVKLRSVRLHKQGREKADYEYVFPSDFDPQTECDLGNVKRTCIRIGYVDDDVSESRDKKKRDKKSHDKESGDKESDDKKGHDNKLRDKIIRIVGGSVTIVSDFKYEEDKMGTKYVDKTIDRIAFLEVDVRDIPGMPPVQVPPISYGDSYKITLVYQVGEKCMSPVAAKTGLEN